MLVVAGRLFPGLGNQYAALGAWDTQLTDQKVAADRPVNLYKPADHDTDHGAHGIFDRQGGRLPRPELSRNPANHRPHLRHCPGRTVGEKARTYRALASEHRSRP